MRQATVPERGERLLPRLDRRRREPVELPEHDRDRQHLAAGGRHHLLQHHREVPLAQQSRHRVDLPVARVGAGRQLGRRRPRLGDPLLLGHRHLQRLQLPAQAAGLGAGLVQRVLRTGAPHVDQRADARGGHADDRGGESERGLVGDHRGHPDDDGDHGQRRTHRDPAELTCLAVARRPHHDGATTSSASSATMSLTRKSFGV